MIGSAGVLEQLGTMSRARNLKASERLELVRPLLADDLAAVEAALAIPDRERAVHHSAQHLLARGGKRLRPICVALASKLGAGFSREALDLAVAVELVHNATLLHDDVVDLGVSRRGAPSARVVYGNAISIFAGDWLLIDALRRVRRSSTGDVMERLLDVIDEMIVAESRQLERRGRLEASLDDWTFVAAGKTAALFRWAMYAGARAGGLSTEQGSALERFGQHLGIAFQAIDDVLDIAGDPAVTGKTPFADLREGKASLPVVLALRARPELIEPLRAAAETPLDEASGARLARQIEASGALDEARRFADDHVARANAILDQFEVSPARVALDGIAHAMTSREA
jgi:octaprenyl-diphosphate synthase